MHAPHGRRGLGYAVTVAVATAAAATLATAAPAHADTLQDRSYPGCPLLIEGATGACVERLQRDLNLVESAYDLPETGHFGELTRIAILDFQGRNRLDADGNVGAETAGALTERLSVSSPRPGAVVPDPARSACADIPDPTTDDYLSGRQCPPRGFPYTPDVVETRHGPRALDPDTDGCSGPLITEDQLHFDFNRACATHDYGYDLVRWGGTPLDEHDVDGYFSTDLHAACSDRSILLKPDCRNTARAYAYFVQLGTPRAKDGITVAGESVDVESISPFRGG